MAVRLWDAAPRDAQGQIIVTRCPRCGAEIHGASNPELVGYGFCPRPLGECGDNNLYWMGDNDNAR